MTESTEHQTSSHSSTSVVDTIQSLVVAFVLAMMFRGFVTEGFVIPTGSMAPTLLGQHVLIRSPQTGATFAVDRRGLTTPINIADPLIGPELPGAANPDRPVDQRMGDRILVLKSLYLVSEPERFDVVVFKTPVTPIGDSANYIKRLIGLPNEQIWLADGDVFARPAGDEHFVIQRKPEHVQRSVWQTIHHSDYIPLNIGRLQERTGRRYPGSPWVGDRWETSGRSYRCETADRSVLRWDSNRRQIDDWTPYNMIAGPRMLVPVSDIRVSAAIVPDQAGLSTTFNLHARSHIFSFALKDQANVGSAVAQVLTRDGQVISSSQSPIKLLHAGKPLNVEFWHVDQSMKIFINGRKVIEHSYDWQPIERLQHATDSIRTDPQELNEFTPERPELEWEFQGSPVTLHQVRLDRDLHYRTHDPNRVIFGSDPDAHAAILGPDHFMMLGDNSQLSEDSRLWGYPHPLVAETIDPAPYLVNRKLLIGKAWVVYFPAPFAMNEGGRAFIPDFGRLRFIR